MFDTVYVPAVEAQGSVLGFIPTHYPAGVVLGEVWSEAMTGVIKFTARTENVDENYGEVTMPIFFSGRDGMTEATKSLIERASGATLTYQEV